MVDNSKKQSQVTIISSPFGLQRVGAQERGNPAPHSWGEHTASSERCQLLRPPGLLCSARSKRCVSKKACQQPACSSLLAAGPQGTELNQSIISTRVPGAAQLSHAQHGTEYFQVLQLVIFFYCSLWFFKYCSLQCFTMIPVQGQIQIASLTCYKWRVRTAQREPLGTCCPNSLCSAFKILHREHKKHSKNLFPNKPLE